MARCVGLFSRSSVARACASDLIDRSNGHLQFPPSTISKMYPAMVGAAPARVRGSHTRIVFLFRRSTCMQSIVTCGAENCLGSTTTRQISQFIFLLKPYVTLSDY